jgi:hypothetical protein
VTRQENMLGFPASALHFESPVMNQSAVIVATVDDLRG